MADLALQGVACPAEGEGEEGDGDQEVLGHMRRPVFLRIGLLHRVKV